MKQQEILEKLQDIITPYLEHPCRIGIDMDLLNDLLINSVDFVNIIIEIEDAFKCKIEDDKMIEMRAIKDIIEYIMEFNKK